MCACAEENETTEHFFMRCPQYDCQRLQLLNSLCTITKSVDIIFKQHSELSNLLMFGDREFNDETNHAILVSSIRIIKATKRVKVIEAYNTDTSTQARIS